MNCKFCSKITEELLDYCVCHSCKIVCFTKQIPMEEKYSRIKDYLDIIQNEILHQRDYFYNLEQRYINKEVLTPEELDVRENIDAFQTVKLELEGHIKNSSSFSDKSGRNSLYKLLSLSKWLAAYFRRENDGDYQM